MTRTKPTAPCPHCGGGLRAIRLPEQANYDQSLQWVCFNDECPYFVEGWAWMREQYRANVSYRYRVDSASGCATPLPVWSHDALKDRIVDAEEP